MKKTVLLICVMLASFSGSVFAAGLTIPVGTQVNVNSLTLNVAGDITVQGTLSVTSGSISLTGNWTNSGTFTYGTATVTLNGTSQTLTGTTTFYKLTKTVTSAATLTLEDTAVFTVNNDLTLSGASGQLLTLTSDDAVNTVDFDLQAGGTQTLDFLHVIRIDSATGIQMNPTSSTNGGGNINWNFGVGEDRKSTRLNSSH